MSTHSRLAPSSAHRWMMCGQSVVPVIGAGIEEDSDASREGTAAHKVGELCLANGKDAFELIGAYVDTDGVITSMPLGVEVTAEMAARVQVRLDYVRKCREGSSSFATEARLQWPSFHPEFKGTIDDVIIYEQVRKAKIIDYKNGFILVDPSCPQLMSYAWMVALTYPDIQNFELTIIQPKNEANPIRSWEISREELELWAYLELLPAMEKAGTGEYVMGDHCKYCPRLKALQCPAHTQAMGGLEQHLQNDMGPINVVSNEELARYKDGLKFVERFAKAVDDELSRRLLTLGQDVPGWKVVEKRADRIWKENLVRLDVPDCFFSKPELMSPAKVEKLPGGAQLVAEWAYKPKNGLTIAPEGDKRNGVSVATLADKFGAYYEQGK